MRLLRIYALSSTLALLAIPRCERNIQLQCKSHIDCISATQGKRNGKVCG